VEDRRILVADDEAATAELLRRLLSSWGYSPVIVSDGRAALAALEASEPPPVALLDWMMPGLDGPAVCRAARAAMPADSCPFLFLLSARTEKADIVCAFEAGADDYITKPFNFAELKARLERARKSLPPDVSAVIGPGTVLDGRWQIDSLLGEGGMGSVWRGTHASLGTLAAIKLIRDDVAETPEVRLRFEHEARAASAVRSPHVAQVYDYGVTPGGAPYLVMELLDGRTLAAELAERGPLPLLEVTQLIGQLVLGMELVHREGIVHRDLKPENVFLASPPADAPIGPLPYVAKIVDFGIALELGRAPLTDPGAPIGTAEYMSPEQHLGSWVGATADGWALGALTFEALTGVSPFDGGGIAATSLRVTLAPLPVPSTLRRDLPPCIDKWFLRACAREPALRFQSVRELGEALCRASGCADTKLPEAPDAALRADSLPPSAQPADAANSRWRLYARAGAFVAVGALAGALAAAALLGD
jgi:serine/threonine-protein kinase